LKLLARNPLRVRIDDAEHTLVEHAAGEHEFSLELDGVRVSGYRYDAGDRVFIRVAGRTFTIPRATRGTTVNRDELRADMPGTVVKHHAKIGQRVAAGDPLVTVESMKLQVTIAADRDAIVGTLPIAEQATFDRGAVLVTLSSLEKGSA
jgi:propionyl-CoA carboxylase alpha chain